MRWRAGRPARRAAGKTSSLKQRQQQPHRRERCTHAPLGVPHDGAPHRVDPVLFLLRQASKGQWRGSAARSARVRARMQHEPAAASRHPARLKASSSSASAPPSAARLIAVGDEVHVGVVRGHLKRVRPVDRVLRALDRQALAHLDHAPRLRALRGREGRRQGAEGRVGRIRVAAVQACKAHATRSDAEPQRLRRTGPTRSVLNQKILPSLRMNQLQWG